MSNIWKNETASVNTHKISIQETSTSLEYLGIISFVDGWSGGNLFIDDLAVSSYNLDEKDKLISVINNKEYISRLVVRTGNDSDHGKVYPWSTYDIEIHEQSLLEGVNKINASSICNNHTITLYRKTTVLKG